MSFSSTRCCYPSQRFISRVFGLLGIGVLCPWNAFINARPYFEARLCGEGSFLTANIEVYFSLVYNVASVLSLAALLLVQYQINNSNNKSQSSLASPILSLTASAPFIPASLVATPTSISRRVSAAAASWTAEPFSWYTMTMVSLTVFLIVFLFTTVAVLMPGIPTTAFLVWTLLGFAICGVCTSIASAGIVGTAGLFDAEVGVGPYFQGQAAGGLFVSIANLVAAAVSNPLLHKLRACGGYAAADGQEEESDSSSSMMTVVMEEASKPHTCVAYTAISWSSFGYFLFGTLSIAVCMFGYHRIEKFKEQRGGYTEIRNQSELAINTLSRDDWEVLLSSKEIRQDGTGTRETSRDESFEESLSIQDFRERLTDGLMSESQRSDGILDATVSVWKKQQSLAFSLFITYVVTLAIFPVITSDLASVHQCRSSNRLFNDLFVPLTFLVFNLGDLVGRFVVTDSTLDKQEGLDRMLFWGSVTRWVFVPLFFMCYSPVSIYKTVAIRSDAFSWAVQFLFAFSNGMITSLCFSHAPSLVSSTEDMQQISSAILNFSLCSGLLLGSCLSFPLFWAFSGYW